MSERATHIDYLHPRHLRVERDGEVFCMAPSCSRYAALARKGLPKFGADPADMLLPRHSSTWRLGHAR
jgi:hypothetical protein